jgi:hypothetical protein
MTITLLSHSSQLQEPSLEVDLQTVLVEILSSKASVSEMILDLFARLITLNILQFQ